MQALHVALGGGSQMSAAAQLPTRDEVRAILADAPLEWLVCDEEAFGLTTATTLQRAIMRAIEGRPLGQLATDPNVLEAFGGRLPTPGIRPREVVLLAGVRSGKSLMTSALATRWSQMVDLALTRRTDTPRINVASVDKDKAHVILDDHLRGTLTSDRLVSCLYSGEEPDAIHLRHPSGRSIECKVVAGKRAGSSLVSRWSGGTIFDEATRMVGSDDGVINLDDMRASVLGRLLPGAQCVYIGSPHAPFGPVYNLYSKHWGNPSAQCLVIKAKGPLMNPVYWTPEHCDEQRALDPDVYRTDVLGEFLTPEEALFPHLALEACARKQPLEIPPAPGVAYAAAMDPGTRGNAWTLAISGMVSGKRTIVFAKQWVGSTASPLSPATVLHDVAKACHRYRVATVSTDQHSFDALRDLAALSGLQLSLNTWTETEKAQMYLVARAWMVDRECDLPPDAALLADLRRVQRKAVATGIRIVLPETGDGRHCDYAPSVVMALIRTPLERAPEDKPAPEVLRMRKEAERRFKGGLE